MFISINEFLCTTLFHNIKVYQCNYEISRAYLFYLQNGRSMKKQGAITQKKTWRGYHTKFLNEIYPYLPVNLKYCPTNNQDWEKYCPASKFLR